MRPERKRELRTNELEQTLLELRQFVQDKGNYIATGVIAVAVVVAATFFWQRQAAASQRAAWNEFYDVRDNMYASFLQGGDVDVWEVVESFRQVAETAPAPALRAAAWQHAGDAAWARLTLITKPLTPDERSRLIDTCVEAYKHVVDGQEYPWVARMACRLSLAAVYELQAADSPDALASAREQYEAVLNDPSAADSPFARLARERLDRLDELSEPIVFPPAPPSTAPAASAPQTPPEPSGESPTGPPGESAPPTAEATPAATTRPADPGGP